MCDTKDAYYTYCTTAVVCRYCTVFLATAKSRTLKPLAFDEYCRFDTSAFFWRINRASLYTPKESRNIKTAVDLFIESYRFQCPRGRVNCQTRARAPRGRHAWRKFTEIYGNPRATATRARCVDFAVAKNTVPRARPGWRLGGPCVRLHLLNLVRSRKKSGKCLPLRA